MKEIIIKVQDNCELKQDGNTYTIIEKEKKLTYKDVASKLFPFQGIHAYTTADGNIATTKTISRNYSCPNNTTSKRQAEKLLAINKLMNVAKYLNCDWQPNWRIYKQYKYYICYVNNYLRIEVEFNTVEQGNSIYFKSKELAQQAIEILGEETIKLALCTDY